MKSPRHSRAHFFLVGGACLVLIGLVLAHHLLEPDRRGHGTHEQLGLMPCPTMAAFDVPCPSCGVTTAVARAVRGELVGAFVTQPFGALLALGVTLLSIWILKQHLGGKDAAAALLRKRPWRAWPVLLTVFVGAWIYKWVRHAG